MVSVRHSREIANIETMRGEIGSKSLPRRARNFIRDMYLALTNAHTLWYVLGPQERNPDELNYPELCIDSYENYEEALGALIHLVVPSFWPFRRQPYNRGAIASWGIDHQFLKPPYDEEIWFYLNGIATDAGVTKANGKALANTFQRPIHLIHNPTDGLVMDLVECILGRTFDFHIRLNKMVVDILARALRGYSKVVLLAHSQGGIVAADVVNTLVKESVDRDLLTRLEIYTFASATDEMLADYDLSMSAGHFVPYYEHFANGQDFVARFGVIACQQAMAGPLFINQECKGHLLNMHYLPGFLKGDYCRKTSRLHKYINRGEPGADDFWKLSDEQDGIENKLFKYGAAEEAKGWLPVGTVNV